MKGTMTVRELIDILKAFAPEMTVVFDDYEQGPQTPIVVVEQLDGLSVVVLSSKNLQ